MATLNVINYKTINRCVVFESNKFLIYMDKFNNIF